MAMGIWGLDFDFDLAFEFERSGAHEGGLHFVVAAADEGFWLATLKVPFPAHFCRPFCFLPISIPNTLRRPAYFSSAVFVFRLFCGFLRTQANLISFFMPLQRIFKLISPDYANVVNKAVEGFRFRFRFWASRPSSHNLASGLSRKLLILIDVLLYFSVFCLSGNL